MTTTAVRIATAWPFRQFHRAIDLVGAKWTAWRTYNRARSLFPAAKDLSIALSTQFKYRENITIGRHVLIGPDTVIGARSPVVLQDHVRISQGVMIETATLDLTQPTPYPHISRPITIEHGAWIGAGAMVLGGVTIGRYAVVAAGAIVTKDVAPHQIVVGARSHVLPDRWAGTHYRESGEPAPVLRLPRSDA